MVNKICRISSPMLKTPGSKLAGISAFAGPLIASKAFFTGANLESFASVQWTYLAIACFGICLIVLFLVVRFPEVRQDTLPEDDAFIKAHGSVGELPP